MLAEVKPLFQRPRTEKYDEAEKEKDLQFNLT